MPNSLIPYTCIYGLYNTEIFVTFENVIAQDQVSFMNQWSIINSKIVVINVQTKSKRKTNIALSMLCSLDSLSDRQCYVRSHFTEV